MSEKTFGELLWAYRNREQGRQMDQSDLAPYANVTRQSVTGWESYGKLPSHADRDRIVGIVRGLVDFGKVTTRAEVKRLLRAGNFGAFNDAEWEAVGLPPETEYVDEVGDDLTQYQPTAPLELVGRDDDIQHLADALTHDNAPMHIIVGAGGIGKTAAAITLMNQLQPTVFTQAVWLSIKSQVYSMSRDMVKQHDYDELTRGSLYRKIARQLHLEHLAALPVDDLQANLANLLCRDPTLILFDNLEDAQAADKVVEWLGHLVSNQQEGCASRVLLTSRETVIAGAAPYDLPTLSDEAALTLLEKEAWHLSAPGLMAEPDDLLDRAVDIGSGLPLILKMIVTRYALGIDLEKTVDLLEAAEDDQVMRYLYEGIWEKLSEPAQWLIVKATEKPIVIISPFLYQAGYEADYTDAEIRRAIMDLVRFNMLIRSRDHRGSHQAFTLHSITRSFLKSDLPDILRGG